jgi:hypothetical protein
MEVRFRPFPVTIPSMHTQWEALSATQGSLLRNLEGFFNGGTPGWLPSTWAIHLLSSSEVSAATGATYTHPPLSLRVIIE